jgi:selenide,water dikinase
MGMIPGGSHRNQAFCASSLKIEPGVDQFMVQILADAQTSGGLFMAVDPDKVESLMNDLESRGVNGAIIGRVGERINGRSAGRIIIV